MNRIFVVLFALACVGVTVLMPWAELRMPESQEQAAQIMPDFIRPLSVMVAPVAGPLSDVRKMVEQKLPGAKDQQTFNYYVYSLFLGLALIAAAFAINAIGREDTEEKTVLPVKK